jgi:hypothetical protein
MLRGLTILVAAGWFLFDAGAVQAQGEAGSCSQLRGWCHAICSQPRQRGPLDRCLSVCDRRHASCLRTGAWRGRVIRKGLRRT